MKVITSPHAVLQPEKPLVFLAGSIEMGTASEWQHEVIQSLAEFQGTILNPRRLEWDASWQQTFENPNFKEQVTWELDGIEKSDYVAFYFDPKTRSPVTLLELGLAIGLGKKICIACPSGFWRKGNVDVLTSRTSIQVHVTLGGLIRALREILPTY